MKTQAMINIIFLVFIFVYQITGHYKIDLVINVEDNIIKTVREQELVYFNDHSFKIDKVLDIPTKKSRHRSIMFYSVLMGYLTFTNLRLRKESITKIYRLTFLYSACYFAFYGLTTLLTLFIPNLYSTSVINLNFFLSGNAVMLVIFVILTYKSLKQ